MQVFQLASYSKSTLDGWLTDYTREAGLTTQYARYAEEHVRPETTYSLSADLRDTFGPSLLTG